MRNTLLRYIEAHGLTDQIFTDRQLSNIIEGSDARRYGLVSRALKEGVLVHLKRGLYCLSTSITRAEFLPDPFAVAQAMQPRSYVSFESALEFHQWIPEAVYTTVSVSPKTKSVRYCHDVLGWFIYHPLAVNTEDYLAGVSRYKYGNQLALIASPLRALMDLVERYKQPWTGIDYIEEGLRVEDEDFLSLRRKDFAKLKNVYKHESTKNFLKNFEIALFERKETEESSDFVQQS